MIVETTLYFARPGQADAVLAMRRKGTALRVALGLAPGGIYVRVGDTGPDVRWECLFESETALQADLAARDASAQFAIQRSEMGALLDRFERHFSRPAED
jgi:hypothetical protein